jgi:hypothetical protein
LTSSKPPTRREEDKEDMQVRVTIHSVESCQFQEFPTSKTTREVSPVSSPLGVSSVALAGHL